MKKIFCRVCAAAAMISIVICGCSKSKTINGIWIFSEDSQYSYEFKTDSTGIRHMGEMELPFKYKVEDSIVKVVVEVPGIETDMKNAIIMTLSNNALSYQEESSATPVTYIRKENK